MNDIDTNRKTVAFANSKGNWRSAGYLLWSAAFLIFLILHLYPIRTGAIRFGILASLFAVWFVSIVLWWSKNWFRNSAVAITILAALFVVLSGRAGDAASFRGY